jgi:hypothetical protein
MVSKEFHTLLLSTLPEKLFSRDTLPIGKISSKTLLTCLKAKLSPVKELQPQVVVAAMMKKVLPRTTSHRTRSLRHSKNSTLIPQPSCKLTQQRKQ